MRIVSDWLRLKYTQRFSKTEGRQQACRGVAPEIFISSETQSLLSERSATLLLVWRLKRKVTHNDLFFLDNNTSNEFLPPAQWYPMNFTLPKRWHTNEFLPHGEWHDHPTESLASWTITTPMNFHLQDKYTTNDFYPPGQRPSKWFFTSRTKTSQWFYHPEQNIFPSV